VHSELPLLDIVLLGVGHTNAHILNMWRMNPLANARLTCISDFGMASYSGMLPGTLAGQYEPSEMQIDLVRLCAAAGARLIQTEVTGLDVKQRKLLFAERPPLAFDAMSIGVGSQPTEVPGEDIHVMRIKPMQSFLPRLDTRLESLSRQVTDRPWRIAVVGGGAGGFEVACCLPRHVQQRHASAEIELTLVDQGHEILKGMPSRTRAMARQELNRQGIQLSLGQEITEVGSEGQLQLADGHELETDLVLWATSARAPEILGLLDLPKDERGFLLIRSTLQSTAADSIYAVGDTGTLQQHPTAKSGVYAVRQGPVLWENLQRQLKNQPLVEWHPQKSFLTLLNTGDDRAILTYKGLGVHARWCLKLKDTIDRRFMAKYQDYSPAMAKPSRQQPVDSKMRCGGCGGKLPADILARVLNKMDNPSSSRVLLGLEQPDDIAVIKNSPQTQTAVTVDFFTTFLDDPHLLGQVAAQNAMSDLYASAAEPQAAVAMVTVPHGPARSQEQFLLEVLDGALRALRPAGVPIVGGHTIEGEQATVGFTIFGDIFLEENSGQQLASKGGLQPGDQLVLTKPLGTGILLAAQQRALCRAEWMDKLVESMTASNRNPGLAVRDMGIRAVTDVTGFGLAGHLWEMLCASHVSAELSLATLPLLAGAVELASRGVESTLAPSNRQVEPHLRAAEETRSSGAYATLFDPQTSGGLLLGVPQDVLTALVERLGDSATVIGHVVERVADAATILVRP